VGNFIQQWYEKAEKPELGEQLQQKLTAPQHSRIFDLVKNPLRLAMLCQSWYFLQGELPETKANLYQRFVDATYEWKQGEFGTTAAQRQQLNQALGNLALRMIDEQISLKESVIKNVMSSEEFELAKRLGWLNEVYRDQKTDERVYAFFHLSFAEYFAACVIDDWDYFLPKNHVDKPVEGKKYRIFENEWNEIFLLWMGRENIDDKKEEFTQALVDFADGVDDFYGYQAFLKAVIAIAEFKNCSLADEIVDQIIKLAFGDFDLDLIPEDAKKTLSLTDTAKVIPALISLLNHTQDEDTRCIVAESLGKIDVGNEEAITALISLLDHTQNEDTRRNVAYSLGNIAVGNEQAIATLISLLKDTQYTSHPWGFAYSLEKIAVGNEQTITALISRLQDSQNEYTCCIVAESLGKIDVGNKQVIRALISLLNDTQYEYTRCIVAESLGKIALGNEEAITVLISLLQDTQDENTRKRVAESLGKIALGNEEAITALIFLLQDSQDENTRRRVSEILGEIAVGNEEAITALISLLQDSQNNFTPWSFAESLGKIAVGNEQAIAALISLLNDTQDEHTRRSVAEILGKILKPENNYLITVSVFSVSNKYLTDEVYENNPDLYKNCFKLLWQCAKNLTYPQFYQAWHTTPTYHPEMADYQPSTDTTTLNQLEQQYTDIYTQLKQLQPTSTTYPILLNAANLEGKTAEKAIAKGILIKIYGEIYPKQKAKTIEDILDLENELQPLREHLKTDKIALIFCDINPHPELINFCQQLQND
jgi:HEAT repeat protein